MNTLTKTDIYGFAFLIFIYIMGIYFSNTNMNFFENVFTKENGSIEYGTSFILLCISLLQLYRFQVLLRYKGFIWKIGMIFLVVIFFYKAGTEISWGQPILGTELEQNIEKKYMNFGESEILLLILVVYFLVLPILYRKFGQLKNFMAAFAIPLVRWQHSYAFIIASGLTYAMPSPKKWEIYELAFYVIFFLTFLNPYNYRIYSKTQ